MNIIVGILLGVSIAFNVLYVISYRQILKNAKNQVERAKEELERKYRYK